MSVGSHTRCIKGQTACHVVLPAHLCVLFIYPISLALTVFSIIDTMLPRSTSPH